MRRTINGCAVDARRGVDAQRRRNNPGLARSTEVPAIALYADPGSGQVYTKRCKHCVRIGEYIPAGSTEEIEKKVERRVNQQTQQQINQERAAMQAEEAQRQAQQQQWNAEMAKQVPRFSRSRRSWAIAGIRRSRSAPWCTPTIGTTRTLDLARSF